MIASFLVAPSRIVDSDAPDNIGIDAERRYRGCTDDAVGNETREQLRSLSSLLKERSTSHLELGRWQPARLFGRAKRVVGRSECKLPEIFELFALQRPPPLTGFDELQTP